jgi:hypothetical protein
MELRDKQFLSFRSEVYPKSGDSGYLLLVTKWWFQPFVTV